MLPGFERVYLEAHCRRFAREAARTAPHFGASFVCGAPRLEDGPCPTACFDMTGSGEGWQVHSEVVVYGLAELNAIYERRAWPLRCISGLAAFFELCFTGTAFRYLRDGWRFFLFFLFPVIVLAAALSFLAIVVLPAILFGPWALFWSLPAALAGALLFSVFGKRLHVLLMMDLWSITVDLARGRRPEVQQFMATVIDDVARRIAATSADEVIVVGHSLGVVPGVLALANWRSAGAASMRPVGLLAAGSYLLAVAHHPAARALRDAARRVMKSPMPWIDAQSHTDPINFFRTNPADALQSQGGDRPCVMEVRFKNQLCAESYRRIRGDFFRTHRQFVFGVDKRGPYALFAMVGGPEPFARVAANKGLSPDWRGFCPESAQRGLRAR